MSEGKPTLILGASENPNRISFEAVKRFLQRNETIYLIGRGKEVQGVKIHNSLELFPNVHTVSIYLSPTNQEEYYEYIISLAPKRVIFNPGSENLELMQICQNQNITVEAACTLVLLSTSQY